jgi:1-acyl-sn-glycerol-3-phosphate acyltransferase
MLERVLRLLLLLVAHVLTGVRALWTAPPPAGPAIFFANHVSHADFVMLWAALPPALRARTRPVAGADYWGRGVLRRYIGEKVVRAVLIERDPKLRSDDPIAQMGAVLTAGESLILFPEGTRNLGDDALLPFKSGLYHLARAHPDVTLIPAWVDNLHRVLPKGSIIPVPLLCTVHFGPSLARLEGESKEAFLSRAREALLAQRGATDHGGKAEGASA